MSKPHLFNNKKHSNTSQNILTSSLSVSSFRDCTESVDKQVYYSLQQDSFSSDLPHHSPWGDTSCPHLAFSVCMKVSNKPKSKEMLSKEGCKVSVSRNGLFSLVFFHVRIRLKVQCDLFNNLYCHLLVARIFIVSLSC